MVDINRKIQINFFQFFLRCRCKNKYNKNTSDMLIQQSTTTSKQASIVGISAHGNPQTSRQEVNKMQIQVTNNNIFQQETKY